jgi:hypothetical protein
MAYMGDVKAKTFQPQSASTTVIAAAQTLGDAGDMNLTGSAVNDGSNMASTVTLTSTGNISGVNFTVTGTDANGSSASEVIAGPNNTTVTTTAAFLTVTQVAANAAVSTNTSVGYTATTTGQGIVFAGATRIRGVLAANVAVAGLLEFKDGSQSGDVLFSIVTTSGTGNINTNIPQDGILFRNGAYLDMQATQVVDGLTVLFDG